MGKGRFCGLAALFALSACDTDDSYQAYTPPSCYSHDPLAYAPILLRINVQTNYSLADPQGFHRYAPSDLLDALNYLNPGKYQLADGVLPNLILTVTVTNDGFDHIGASMEGNGNGEGYLFSYTWAQNYVTLPKLNDDIADQIDQFVTQGWHRGNC